MSLFNSSRFEIGDPYYDKVSLLLHSNGANGSTSFIDETGKTITAFGNAQISTAQGKFGGSSIYFDGTGDYATIPANTDFKFGGGDFTIEFFVNMVALPTGNAIFMDFGADAGNTWPLFTIYINSTGFVFFNVNYDNNNSASTLTSTTAIGTAAWNHIAIVRNVNLFSIYTNGVLSGTMTWAFSIWDSNKIMCIGTQPQLATNYTAQATLNAYLDEIRITKDVARYTQNFIPPRAPFLYSAATKDVYYSNTSLLLHFNGNNDSTVFTDTSITPKTVTANGNAKISTTQSKFGGSSAYFDGTGDYLSIPNNIDFAIGGYNFTVEVSVYCTNDVIMEVFSCRNASNPYYFLRRNVGGAINFYSVNTSGYVPTNVTTTETVALNTWTHIVVMRLAGKISIYLDGNIATLTGTNNIDGYSTPTQSFLIGAGTPTTNFWQGYIDELRITKDSVRYKKNFTPPTKQFPDYIDWDPYYSNTSLLLNCNGNNDSTVFTDTSITPKTITVFGDAKISTTQSKFGGSSAYFGGTGDISTLASDDFWLTGDFTIDFWMRPSVISGTYYGHCVSLIDGSGNYEVRTQVQDSKVKFLIYHTATYQVILTSVATIVVDEWTHVAAVRSGDTHIIFINGNLDNSLVKVHTIPSVSWKAMLGFITVGTSDFRYQGYIDDARITKGVARYTQSFTPPTKQFPGHALFPVVKGNIEFITSNYVFINTSGAGMTVSTPAETRVGDMCVIICSSFDSTSGSGAVGAGWTSFGGGSMVWDGYVGYTYFFYKVMTAAGVQSYTTSTSANGYQECGMIVLRGTYGVGVVTSAESYETSVSRTVPIPYVSTTTTGAGQRAVHFTRRMNAYATTGLIANPGQFILQDGQRIWAAIGPSSTASGESTTGQFEFTADANVSTATRRATLLLYPL